MAGVKRLPFEQGRRALNFAGIMMLSLLASACQRDRPFFFDFESDAELDRLHWECRALLTLATDPVAHGERSLRLEMFPGNFPGLKITRFDPDWSAFHSLHAAIYNPQPDTLQVHFRIDDRRESPAYADRCNRRIRLPPGWTQFVWPLDSLITTGTRRRMQRSNIESVYFFLQRPAQPVTLYFDHLHLE
ncbi:MAG: hypothetical protein ONB48_10055 [candidate division KSB1 bacterium]|nr:hypothetical protein [candidate division KSB1 bacterium]MDZ7273830.1 hypothetical protein [candidate division KSB1 bacterium]MDZ7285986.1 hypothetical protein [candidate division KSB1 bacterium]MDZ7299018.1 hypothetical protein [candidate division KSB1 bacterium]MDZ7349837.1 hypothetical protein [candidate division KSB1 bacterium]